VESPTQACWLILQDEFGVGAELARQLKEQGYEVVTVMPGQQFSRTNANSYTLDPLQKQHFIHLFEELQERNRTPTHVIHLWTLSKNVGSSGDHLASQFQQVGFYSVLWTAQAVIQQNVTSPVRITIVSGNMHLVTGTEQLAPGASLVLGVCKS